MENPLLTESKLPFGAPQFDKIRNEHYMPAFEQGIAEAKAEIDAIANNPEAPTFENTIEAMEYSGETLDRVSSIFYNLMEADVNEQMQQIAEEVAPMLNDYSMYVSLNEKLFERVKAVYEQRDSLALEKDQLKLLENTYRSFTRNGANLQGEDREKYSRISEELSLTTLAFQKNLLAATNAYVLNITDSTKLDGLPAYVVDAAAESAAEKGLEGWAFTLDYPSYSPFMKYCNDRELRRQMYMAYGSRAVGGEYSNCENVSKIIDLRIQSAQLLGYRTYADYALEVRMAKDAGTVNKFLADLMNPSLPYARADVKMVEDFARKNGFEGDRLMGWDFSYWSEKLQKAEYDLSEELLKPYFKLENCIDAVFDLAHRLYGINFKIREDIPGYHKDVKVYEVTDEDGSHLALFYADFFPRPSKRGGAWMTEFRGQSIKDGVERRPFISIVTNFSKPTASTPSLITHYEFTTFLHEFGHALHGMLAEGRYGSLTGTSVARDFVELPSQIMENWGYEPEYLNTFAKHYQTGESIPMELIDKIVASKNYLSGYSQVRQLQFGLLDMAWHSLESLPQTDPVSFEKAALKPYEVMPGVAETAISPGFSHIFAGGYAAGYYSYKWAEVLEADAFSLFQEKGIFNTEVSHSFRENILSRGGSEDAAVLYRNFRGHDPEPEALMKKLGLSSK
ncbi:MAG: M3 family metallopeptidase [Bacteroidales bacterium]|nr:M3 family metallopeptidase [Bacteroidales bacterium]MDY6170939.1 M3 family metallopeptidase [Candidatus Cryptobacteroides sp.]